MPTPASMMAWIVTAWAWLKDNKEQLTVVFTAVAAGWAMNEYFNKQDAERRAESLKYLERYHGAEYGQARMALFAVAYDPGKRPLLLEARRKGPKELQKFVGDNALTTHILRLAELYVGVAQCQAAKICDRRLACDNFADDALALYRMFVPLFDGEWKEMWGENVMAKPVQFASDCKGQKVPPAYVAGSGPQASSAASTQKP